jgi:FAD/FMN-containing dehydrogenase
MRRRDFCKATVATTATTLPIARLMSATAPIVADVPAITLSGETTTIEKAAVKDLRASLRGELVLRDDAGYDAARRIWNAMIDRRPALIARCADATDVASVINFARERSLLLSVRGGGHSFPGYSVCEGGVMLDLSPMRAVHVDPAGRTVTAGAGAWGRHVDSETQRHGLATTLGQISDTGVAGLTLGGGFGWLGRRFGLACDNLIAADLVTADGKLRRVSSDENPDLFWAIRGGGGNFGVATSFQYRLHPMGPKVVAGRIAYPARDARAVMQFYDELAATTPRELSTDLEVAADGKGPGISCAIHLCYSGKLEKAEKALAPLQRFGPVENTVKVQDYLEVQKQFDDPPDAKTHHYMKGGFVREFSPGLIEALANGFRPDATMGIYFQDSSGAVADISATDTAFPHRRTRANMMLLAEWEDPAYDEAGRAAVRANWDKVDPFTEGYYVNLSEVDQQRTGHNYGPNYARLVELKKKYDPDNLFQLNANIRPAG